MTDSIFLFQEAAPVSVRSREAEAESGWAAALACSAEVHSLVPEVDFRAPADEFLALVVDSPSPVADFRAWVAALADSAEVHSLAPEADSREVVGRLD